LYLNFGAGVSMVWYWRNLTDEERAQTDGENSGDSGALTQLVDRIISLPSTVRWLIAALLLGLVVAIDLTTGREVSFSIFYLVPVSFAGAFVSRGAGAFFAVLSAVAWGYLELTTGPAYSANWIPYWNTAVRLAFFILVNELIHQLRKAHLHQQALASQDSLTGIANSRVFREYTQRAIFVSQRSGRPFTVAILDLDEFKQVNDSFGHAESDTVIRTTASLMEKALRPTDLVARLGGDEFGILMADTDDEQASVVLERVARNIREGVSERWGVDVTVGAVTFSDPPADVDQILREADVLMYRGKAGGRGRILQAQR
jgi:diguanylate cyclase (GGDEF)-like protein